MKILSGVLITGMKICGRSFPFSGEGLPHHSDADPSVHGNNLGYYWKNRENIPLLRNAFKLLFEDVKSLLDIFKVPAARENDLS